jgi:hypothetical protein
MPRQDFSNFMITAIVSMYSVDMFGKENTHLSVFNQLLLAIIFCHPSSISSEHTECKVSLISVIIPNVRIELRN